MSVVFLTFFLFRTAYFWRNSSDYEASSFVLETQTSHTYCSRYFRYVFSFFFLVNLHVPDFTFKFFHWLTFLMIYLPFLCLYLICCFEWRRLNVSVFKPILNYNLSWLVIFNKLQYCVTFRSIFTTISYTIKGMCQPMLVNANTYIK